MEAKLKIGLIGLDFASGNLGCAALSYSFSKILGIVNEWLVSNTNLKIEHIVVFSSITKQQCSEVSEQIGITVTKGDLPRNLLFWKQIQIFNTCDFIFDFTAGDSFSDIYGSKRFVKRSITKINATLSKCNFVLGSQTYGPFKKAMNRQMAGWIIKHSDYAFARDKISCEYAESICGVAPQQTIDVAFALPYVSSKCENERIRVGINPSGLLWNGGYNESNQFSLMTDYQVYCCKIIEKLLECDKYEIHLIPHVLSSNLNYPDNDVIACRALNEKFPRTIMAPLFSSPIEAKTYISQMDIFTGARMHATIAAFSSEVATIPFAYSRKFIGVYEAFSYNHTIDGTKVDTETAISNTLGMIEDIHQIEAEVQAAQKHIEEGIELIITTIYDLLLGGL